MTSELSESFFVGSRGNLANSVLPFQIIKAPLKVLKGENKGGTHSGQLSSPLGYYYPVRIYNSCKTILSVLLL